MMMRMLDGERLTVGYLLPTRDAIMLGRPAAGPLIELGVRAEQLGFDAVWAGDSPLARARHDALLMLAALAPLTERAVLGTAVMLGALRPALLLAQAAATLDLLCEGRLVLGLGAGFPYPETERQFAAVGVPFEGRVRRLSETIGALRALWADAGEPVSVEGRHVALEDVALAPAPHRAGGPPIWLAGAGEAAERRVGRIGDGWLPYPPSPDLYAQGWERVRESAASCGREAPPVPGLYATVTLDRSEHAARERLRRNIERYYEQPLELIASIQAMYAGTPEGFQEWLGGYVAAGARHVVLRVTDEDPAHGLEQAAEARALALDALAGMPR
jgi:alkanesulfonate monooxygenase SsuD/methylene tetrahydromethanopterin reductase-like flavin-dependent oxidoreductase (luciferase family)